MGDILQQARLNDGKATLDELADWFAVGPLAAAFLAPGRGDTVDTFVMLVEKIIVNRTPFQRLEDFPHLAPVQAGAASS